MVLTGAFCVALGFMRPEARGDAEKAFLDMARRAWAQARSIVEDATGEQE